DEDTVRCLRSGGGTGGVLCRRGGAVRGLPPENPCKKQVSRQASTSSALCLRYAQFEGNGDGVSKWSRILKSVEEVHDENLGDPDNISWTVPESLPTHHPVLDTDYDAISTDTMEMELNNVAHLPNFGFLTIDDHLQQQQQYQHNPISRKRQRDELRRET
ncbi:hypothetical protein Pfo_013751, partial [Paulownia fortunei]